MIYQIKFINVSNARQKHHHVAFAQRNQIDWPLFDDAVFILIHQIEYLYSVLSLRSFIYKPTIGSCTVLQKNPNTVD